MIKSISCATLSVALEQLKITVKNNEDKGLRTVVFCEDRLSLAAERTVCAAVEGTFLTSVYTFARFLAAECGKPQNVLSAQGSAMAVRRIIEENRGKLSLFKQLSSPTAAQAVYDTIALLYSSRISAEDVEAAAESGKLLGGKLKDIALIYAEYMQYLKDNGLQDRNGYLKRLASVIEQSPAVRGATVVFLGFQAFTCTTTECAGAAFVAANDVVGLFIGGREDIYVNEASRAFIAAAKEFGGAENLYAGGELLHEAEVLRQSLFNPESFYKTPQNTTRVRIFEACDGEEELEFIAATIKKHVIDGGERYAKISVMLPDLGESERALSRVFSRYRIPYYADRRIPLAEHPLCAFVFSWLNCVISGCRPQDVDAVVASPFFPAERQDKDIFRNYALRFANFRGGVKRQPKKEILEGFNFDISAVERVRQTFLTAYGILSAKSNTFGIFGGLRALLEEFKVGEKLKSLNESFRKGFPVHAGFGARALDGVLSVISEAETLSDGLPLKDIVKILKSGFSAMEISLIPPKADAVFVGDIAATANTGSNVVFAARLNGDVPDASSDTALLTDREISALEGVNINVSPKIRQVNLRKRETVALNICAFRENLYLSYPVSLNGEESGASEIISYAKAVFKTEKGEELKPINIKDWAKTAINIPYYASEKLPAVRQLLRLDRGTEEFSAVHNVLCSSGYKAEAEAALMSAVVPKLSEERGRQLYINYNSLTPTALETYFSCPYLGFMRQGLKVQEREEGVVRPVDTGNFIHSVLEELAREINGIPDMQSLEARAAEIAAAKLEKAPYSSLLDIKSGQYTANELKSEAVKVSAGMFEQLKNSRFTVSTAESSCELRLAPDLKIFGRIDRVDECGDMVRIVDYKTGTIDCSASKYYTGAKLQLPLYLLAVSGGRRAAGAYYFPAAVEYREKEDGVFRLQGFMDGSEDVVKSSDKTVQEKERSSYVDAYLNGNRKVESAMEREDFSAFLEYSRHIAQRGARQMIGGNCAPSPTAGACDYCAFSGCCSFDGGSQGERTVKKIKCAQIAQIAREEKQKGDE